MNDNLSPEEQQKLPTSSKQRMNFVYKNFDVRISPSSTKQNYHTQVSSPVGEATHDFVLSFKEYELEYYLSLFGRTPTITRRNEPPDVEVTKKIGTKLFNAVFADTIRDRLFSSIEHTRQRRQRLRIRLNLTDVPELANLPWEYIYSSAHKRFLALSRDTPVVRYLDEAIYISPLDVTFPLNMLVMISNPKGREKLDVEAEWQRLEESVSELKRRGLLRLKRLPRATLPALHQELSNPDLEYHIFHFIGHGGYDTHTQEGVLMFENDQGGERKVSGQRLVTQLQDNHSLRLVVINACEGARSDDNDSFSGVAQTLMQTDISSVVAMQFDITDEAAKIFAHKFYDALARRYPVDAALSEARKGILATGNDLEWGTPVLFMRADDGVLFNLPLIERPESQVRNSVPSTRPQDH